jgi:hypothetical protein
MLTIDRKVFNSKNILILETNLSTTGADYKDFER